MKKRLMVIALGLVSATLVACSGAKTEVKNEITEAVSEVVETTEEAISEEETIDEEEASAEIEEVDEVLLADKTLKELFAEHDMKVGTCLSPSMIDYPKAKEILLEQFNSVTLENAMKPENIFNKKKSIEAGDLVVEFNKDAIKLLDFAKENGLSVRGHTLVWYSQTPDWIFYEDFSTSNELVSKEVMLSRMESYIRQVFEYLTDNGYADMFYAYDVVNEAVEDNGALRDNYWKQIIGDDYMVYAFTYADKYAPENIDLYYNDFNEQFKAGALVKLAETLVDDEGNYLIDGFGLQAHLYTQDDMNKYFKMLDKLSETGLKIELTELDVSLGTWQNTLEASEDNLKTQGKFYYNLINEIFTRKEAGTLNTDALTFWGFGDGMSWRKNASPLLYDANLEPKYAFYGALQLPVD